MINNTKAFILLLFSTISIFNILNAQSRIDTTRVDFNNDKIIDTLIDNYSSGSNFGGSDFTIIDGKTKEEYTLSNYGCYCSFTNLITVPDSLLLEKNASFFDVLRTKAVTQKRDTIDATLEWLLSASFNSKYLKEHSYFKTIFNPKTKWESHKAFLPESYHIEVSGDTLQQLTSQYEKKPVSESSKAFLVYYTSAHYVETLDNEPPVAKNETYEIYKTPHTVYAKKGDTHKWLFISETGITGAPGKLRWYSINHVELVGDYVLIHQDIPPANAYVIHIVNVETQRVGSLKFDTSQNNGTDQGGMITFEIVNDHLVFTEYSKQKINKIPLQELFNSLDNYKDE